MSEQPCIPGLEPESINNLFFAFCPETGAAADAAATALDLRNELNLESEPFKLNRYHISLFSFGAYLDQIPREIVRRAARAALMVEPRPLVLRLDQAASFASRKAKAPVVLLGGDGLPLLAACRADLGEAMIKCGLGRWVRPVRKLHMTMMYDRRRVPPRDVGPVISRAGDLVLIQSHYGESRYTELDRWRIAA